LTTTLKFAGLAVGAFVAPMPGSRDDRADNHSQDDQKRRLLTPQHGARCSNAT
jgi:hypothetical protein